MDLSIKTVSGPGIQPYIHHLARLRIDIFRSFPYLYDGDMEYEKKYLDTYLQSDDTVMVLVLDGDDVVGASSGLPMDMESAEVKRPFLDRGMPVDEVFYFGESLLQPAYRGRGLGHAFFDEREAHARSLGRFRMTAFFAVQRPENHPLRPSGYRPLDGFWKKRGYVPQPGMMTTYRWRDIGEKSDTDKPMMFWTREALMD